MAGDWIKVECTTPEKSETLALTAAMGWDDPDLTVGKLFRLWRWFDQHTTDGNARGVTSVLIDRIVGVTGFAQELQKVGWLIINDDGISLPNFDRHNGMTAKNRAQTAKRVARHRATTENEEKTSNAKSNAPNVTSALAREEKRREEKNSNNPPNPPKGGKAKFDPAEIELPNWLSSHAWERWCADRKQRRKPITELGAQQQLVKLDEYRADGFKPEEVIAHSIASGYQGLYPPPRRNGVNNQNESKQEALERRNAEVAARVIAELEAENNGNT